MDVKILLKIYVFFFYLIFNRVLIELLMSKSAFKT